MPGITSLYEMFTASVEKVPNNRCLGRRVGDEFQWMSYKETAAAAAAIGSAMADVGLKPHDRVGIYGVNCPEWMIAMQGCNRMNLYCIPLYDSLGENAIEFIINHSEASIVFSQFDKLKELGKALPKVNSLVKTVVYWGNGDVKVVEDTKSKGVAVYSFEDFMALGKSKPKDASPPKPEDLCTIMYTSGTTGDPKVRIDFSLPQMHSSLSFFSSPSHLLHYCSIHLILREWSCHIEQSWMSFSLCKSSQSLLMILGLLRMMYF